MSAIHPTGLDIRWPTEDSTRIPFEVFCDKDLYELELDKIFSGPHWTYLALEQEVPNRGDFTTTYVGERCVVVNRGLDGEINAFGIASRLTENMGVLHFEKAFASKKGLYQYFDRECARRLFKGCSYINKESDMNVPGLAKAKKSYHPVMTVKSYILTVR